MSYAIATDVKGLLDRRGDKITELRVKVLRILSDGTAQIQTADLRHAGAIFLIDSSQLITERVEHGLTYKIT